MDNNKKYFDSPEFGRLLQRYERSLQIGKDEYFESDELSDIAEYYYDKKDKPRAEYVLDYAMHLHPGAVLPRRTLKKPGTMHRSSVMCTTSTASI